MIRGKLLGTQTKEFDKSDLVANTEENEEEEREWDEDMQDFDQMMKDSVSEAKRIQEEEMRKAKIEAERLRRE